MTSGGGGLARALTVAACVLLSACYSGGRERLSLSTGAGPSGASVPPATQWRVVQLRSGRATLRMPSEPRYMPATSGVEDDGAVYQTVIAGEDYGSLQLMVAVSEVQGGIVGAPLDRLDDMRETMLERAEQRAFGSIMVDGSPGFEMQYRDRENGNIVHARAVVARNHVYLLMAIMAPQLEAVHRTTAATYLGSLRLDPAESFGATGDGVYVAGGWRWSVPAEAYFAVRFPGAPVAAEATSPVTEATFVRTYRVVGEGGATFEVRATGYDDGRPAGAVATLESAPLAHYTLRAARDTTRQGYSGRSLVYESEGRMRFTLLFATYAATYEVSVDLPRTAGPDLLEARNTFLDSFRML